jgi:putative oxidoreductase
MMQANGGETTSSGLPGRLILNDYLQLLSRVLISIVFIIFGFLQFTNIGVYIANPGVVKFAAMTGGILTPTIIAYLVATIDLVGGILILFGFQTRWVTLVVIAFVILTLFIVHNFWTMEGPARAANQAHFYKNLALIGGLLMFHAFGPGRYSVDARMRS